MGLLSNLCDDTREDWGAVAPSSTIYTVPLTDKDQFLTHWDGGSPLGLAGKPHSACLAQVKRDQAFHMGPSRGWADIGYNTLVCPHGRLIEGRGVLTVGAQCPGYNRSGIGSQLMVGKGDPLSQAMLIRQRQFYNEIHSMRGGEPTRMMGHRDGFPTECPGDPALKWIRGGMAIPGAGGLPSTPTPSPSTPTPPSIPPAVSNPPGPRLRFPLPSGYYFGEDDGTKWSVSGRYGRVFSGRTDRSWIQEFASQLSRRGWPVGKGKRWLPRSGNDGIFGDEYGDLVSAFQADQGLPADRKLGGVTWRAAYFNRVT